MAHSWSKRRSSTSALIAKSLVLFALAGCRGPSAPDVVVPEASASDATISMPDANASDSAPREDRTAPDASVESDGAVGVDGSTMDAMDALDAINDGAVIALDASDAGSVRADAPPYSRPDAVDVPSLPDVSFGDARRDDAGNVIAAQTEQGAIVLVPGEGGPIHVLARCAALVSHCVEGATRTLDACMASAPTCTTATPWSEPPCCPAACAMQYETRRRAGDAPLRAFDRTLFGEPSCVAGLPSAGGM